MQKTLLSEGKPRKPTQASMWKFASKLVGGFMQHDPRRTGAGTAASRQHGAQDGDRREHCLGEHRSISNCGLDCNERTSIRCVKGGHPTLQPSQHAQAAPLPMHLLEGGCYKTQRRGQHLHKQFDLNQSQKDTGKHLQHHISFFTIQIRS